jgi:hypothetical protein
MVGYTGTRSQSSLHLPLNHVPFELLHIYFHLLLTELVVD